MSTNGGLFGGSWDDLTGWLRGKPKEEERRTTSRLPVHDLAQLSWRLESGLQQSTTVNLVDVSDLGFKVRSPEEVPLGMSVRLTDSNGKSAAGSIIHSEPDEDAFMLGANATWESAEDSPAEPLA
jgi:hypothetical protein